MCIHKHYSPYVIYISAVAEDDNRFFDIQSISVVKFWQFMLATVFYQPRIFLAVFIGSRIAKLSDSDQRGQMDTSGKLIILVHIR